MIKSLRIQNCQSHKDTFLEFDKGVNCVVGPSDKGKSAIFNALYKTIYNRPLGEQWRSWGGGKSVIDLEIDDHLITYTKDKKASYTITNPDGETLDFNAFGSDVPQEVTQLLNVDRKINIQQQLERDAPIFLISESPGEVAKFFNRVAGLYKIDLTIKKGKQDLNKSEKGFNVTKELITEKKEELVLYDEIEDLVKKVKKAELYETKLKQTNLRQSMLSVNLMKIEPLKQSIKLKEQKLKTKTKINKAIDILNEYQGINDKVQTLDHALFEINDLNESIQKQTQRIKALPQINKGLLLFNKVYSISNKISKLNRLKTAIDDTFYEIEHLNVKHKRTALEYDKIKPKTCPLCNRKW